MHCLTTPSALTAASCCTQSQARGAYSKASENSSLPSLSQADLQAKLSLRAVKTGSATPNTTSSLTTSASGPRSPTKIRSPTRRRALLQQQQLLASAAQRSSLVDQHRKLTEQVLAAPQSPTVVAVVGAGNPTESQQAAIQQVLEKIKDARESAAKLGLQRNSYGGAAAGAGAAGGVDLEQQQPPQPEQPAQQQPSWKLQQLRPGGFLHLDRWASVQAQ